MPATEMQDMRDRLDDHAKDIADLGRRLEGHLGECRIRHMEIIRRQDESKEAMTAMSGKLDGFVMALNNKIHQTQMSGNDRWLKIAGAVGLALVTGLVGYFARGGR